MAEFKQLVFSGGEALSNFRLCQLLETATSKVDRIHGLATQNVIFAETTKNPSSEEIEILEKIISATLFSDDELKAASSVSDLVVVPRFGTLSPWSSKATEIVKICGVDWVSRVEKGIRYNFQVTGEDLTKEEFESLCPLLHDRMTEVVLEGFKNAELLFTHKAPKKLERIPVLEGQEKAIMDYNKSHGLALAKDEINYLVKSCNDVMNRNITDVEIMMFAQVNSEHCRHKIFNADFIIDDEKKDISLFGMIRNTYNNAKDGVLSAYSDNASVIEGSVGTKLIVDGKTKQYTPCSEKQHILMKVETHNHPTAISPFPGAATGSGGEIRDEGAVGRGSKPKAGLTGFSVSHLRIPGHERPWEIHSDTSTRHSKSIDIMTEGPLGGAAFNNEFGRPCLTGYFRTLTESCQNKLWGYHKPIMIAGGVGNIREENVHKGQISEDSLLIVLGGPSMLIGLGGGAASSVDAGGNTADLDFASVQRHNPEMQRRCQEVIDACCALGKQNPIESIHDVGAGGLSNAFPELVHDSNRGAIFDLQKVPCADSSLSPMELWCNESQERYVLAIKPDSLPLFTSMCERERCLFGVVGVATLDQRIVLKNTKTTDENEKLPIDLPGDVLFGKPPKMLRDVKTFTPKAPVRTFDFQNLNIKDACERLMLFPAIASKSFLITIGDRSVTGLVHRDQMVGKWQTPVADVAVTCSGYDNGYKGEAMAMGERTPYAILDSARAARLAVCEALLNLYAANVKQLKDIRLSANWMAACGTEGQDAALYAAVKTVGMEICPSLDIAIPVGKDSLSMRAKWQDEGKEFEVVSPVSLVITAFAPVENVNETLTPELQLEDGESVLVLCSLKKPTKERSLGASCLSQVYNAIDMDDVPDVDISGFRNLIECLQKLRKDDPTALLAYHDRSDGGLFVTLAEMAFSSRCGLAIDCGDLSNENLARFLFNEEVGFVVQVLKSKADKVIKLFNDCSGVEAAIVASPLKEKNIIINANDNSTSLGLFDLLASWSETSYLMQARRDNPICADEEFASKKDELDPGLSSSLTFNLPLDKHFLTGQARPRVAILREQGVNGHIEMANAFYSAGFDCIDTHMSDIIENRVTLNDVSGIACCGGFSYGDVLGAGQGWAKGIQFHENARQQFYDFFHRTDTFSLGVCNGCQMLSSLSSLIPGADNWPKLVRNKSEQFEARVCMVEVCDSPSVFLSDMKGSKLPIAVAHGEGRLEFDSQTSQNDFESDGLISLKYVDNYGKATERYPFNPNGSANGTTGFSSKDGRVLALMPHPERNVRSYCNSYRPKEWVHDDSPWLNMFLNARRFVLSKQ